MGSMPEFAKHGRNLPSAATFYCQIGEKELLFAFSPGPAWRADPA